MRVAVIGGGQNCEHDVSLASAEAVTAALMDAGHMVVNLMIGHDGVWRDREMRPVGLAGAVHVVRSCDVAVPMVHGPRGEDGALAALLQLADVPYVGCPLGAAAVAMDKWATKAVAQSLGIEVAPGVLVTSRNRHDVQWTGPVVVKPVAAGSSHGVTLVRAPEQFEAALDAAFAIDDRVLIESVVHGREIDLTVWMHDDAEPEVMPPAEVVVPADRGVFDLDTKYDGSADIRVPADITAAQFDALKQAALTLTDALGCRHIVRVDFFLVNGRPVLNEINTTPGFTVASQVPRMCAAAGYSLAQVTDRLVAESAEPR